MITLKWQCFWWSSVCILHIHPALSLSNRNRLLTSKHLVRCRQDHWLTNSNAVRDDLPCNFEESLFCHWWFWSFLLSRSSVWGRYHRRKCRRFYTAGVLCQPQSECWISNINVYMFIIFLNYQRGYSLYISLFSSTDLVTPDNKQSCLLSSWQFFCCILL